MIEPPMTATAMKGDDDDADHTRLRSFLNLERNLKKERRHGDARDDRMRRRRRGRRRRRCRRRLR